MNSRKRVVRYYKTSVGFALVKNCTVVFAQQKRFTRSAAAFVAASTSARGIAVKSPSTSMIAVFVVASTAVSCPPRLFHACTSHFPSRYRNR
jgi:hypothetical protein